MSLTFHRTGTRQEIFDGDTLICWYDEQVAGQEILFCLGGKLRGDTAYAFLDELRALLSVGMSIVLDLKEVTYLAPSYMQAMLQAQRTAAEQGNAEIVLQNLSDPADEAMCTTGVISLFTIREAS